MTTKNAKVEIQNVSDFAITQPYPYWICTVVDNKLCFYGAYRTKERAKQVLDEYKWEHGAVIVERMEE